MNTKPDGQAVRRLRIGAMPGGQLTARDDAVAVEERLEIRLALPGDMGPGRAVGFLRKETFNVSAHGERLQ